MFKNNQSLKNKTNLKSKTKINQNPKYKTKIYMKNLNYNLMCKD